MRDLINNFERRATLRPRRILLESEDRGPDLSDRLVELIDGAGEPLLKDLVVRGRGEALQTESRGEQPLDYVILEDHWQCGPDLPGH